MIVKPTESTFRLGRKEQALVQTGKIAIEGSKGVVAGFVTLRNLYLKLMLGIMALGLAGALAAAAHPLLGGVLVLGGLVWMIRRWAGGERRELDILDYAQNAEAGVMASALSETGEVELDVSKLFQRGVVLGLPGVAMIFLSRGGVVMMLGMALLILALLVSGRAFLGRRAARWDRHGITAHGLLNDRALRWDEIGRIGIEDCPLHHLSTLISTGARRNLVLTPRYAMAETGLAPVLLPLDLLAMEEGERDEMIARLLACHAHFGHRATPESKPAEAAPPPPPPAPSPMAPPGFDPDAIMARYLAQREGRAQMPAPETPAYPPVAPRRGGFGRKGV